MKTLSPNERRIVAALRSNGNSIMTGAEGLKKFLERQGQPMAERQMFAALRRLQEFGVVRKVPGPGRGSWYLLEEDLERVRRLSPALAQAQVAMLRSIPIRAVDRGRGWSSAKIARRERKIWRDYVRKAVLSRRSHDHSSLDRACPLCDLWPPPMTGNLPGIPKGTLSRFVS